MMDIDLDRAVVVAVNSGKFSRASLVSPGQTEYQAEVKMFYRPLTQGEKVQFDRLFADYQIADKAGRETAEAGGKLRSNPHVGGTAAWWGWNNGYKAWKKWDASFDRYREGRRR